MKNFIKAVKSLFKKEEDHQVEVVIGPAREQCICEMCEEKIKQGYSAVMINDDSAKKIFCPDCGIFTCGLLFSLTN